MCIRVVSLLMDKILASVQGRLPYMSIELYSIHKNLNDLLFPLKDF